jgi:hypothetical protein
MLPLKGSDNRSPSPAKATPIISNTAVARIEKRRPIDDPLRTSKTQRQFTVAQLY